MNGLVRTSTSSLLERTRDLATLPEDEQRRLAAQAARDRDADALWALLETHLTLHGSAGSRVSRHTLSAYRRGLYDLLKAWQGENLLRPGRNAGVLWVRELEGRLKPAPVGVKKRLGAACRVAKVKFRGVHALRHAAGTRLRDETGDLALVADHLRHSSPDTARGYAKADNAQLKKAVGSGERLRLPVRVRKHALSPGVVRAAPVRRAQPVSGAAHVLSSADRRSEPTPQGPRYPVLLAAPLGPYRAR